jgi:hypothetical protein
MIQLLAGLAFLKIVAEFAVLGGLAHPLRLAF